jgi:DNA-binding winged helix-turn-helix (wHTH) protein/tetratricopeptide (TPR) repeat protein
MSTSRTAHGAYVFDRFRLSADGTLLLRDGEAVPLAPKVLHTLLVLVQHAGEVVRKEDLMHAVWPDCVVEETGLTRNISLLRQALADDGQRFIATIARIGYRFVGPVERIDDVAASRGQQRRTRRDRSQHEPAHLVVGRDGELKALYAALERARAGQGGILAISGEPGIGKTTVVDTFLQEVGDSCLIGRGSCSERLAGAEPHLPLLEALDEVTTADPALIQPLCRTAPTWSQHIAPASEHRVNGSEMPGTGTPERLMRELTAFLQHASEAQPMIIVIEDLHWADVSTIDVLAHLAARLSRMAVLVLVTYRRREMLMTPHPFARLSGELIARGHLTEVQVRLLRFEHVRDYLRLSFGTAPVEAELPGLVFQRTEGNPLFMVEVVRYLRQQGLPSRMLSLTADVPSSLRGLIDRVLQGLDRFTRQLLSIAAVQGYEFDSATLARVSGRAASDVEEHLRNADQIHALVRFDREDESGDGTLSLVYRFAHVLYQDALTGAIAPSRRIEWARQIAEALVLSHSGSTDSIAGSLALLFETGREFWKAAEFFLHTSKHATRLFAFATASELASRGLQCLRSARAVQPGEMARRELDLTLARLVPLASIRGYATPDVEQLTQRGVELAEEVGDVSAIAMALNATWIVRMVRGECLAAKNAGTRVAMLAGSIKNDVLLINAHMQAQIACHHLGEFHQAQEHAAAVMVLAGEVPFPDRCISVMEPVVGSLAESARNWWIMGYLVRALADCEAAVALGRELRHPDSLAFAWLFHAWINGYRGEWRTCLGSAQAGAGVARESGSVQTLAWNLCVQGWARAHVGDVEAGEKELAAAIDMSRTIWGQVALPQFIAMMAEVLFLRDDPAAAEEWLKQASEFEQTHDDRYFAAEVRRLSAMCCAKRGRIADACKGLHEAIDVARSQSASTLELRAALNLAELEPREGREAVCTVLARVPEPEPWPEVEAARRILQ